MTVAECAGHLVMQLTESIGFSVACLIDEVAGFEHDGEENSPMLTFLVGDDELEFAGGNSWMREHVYGLLPSVRVQQPRVDKRRDTAALRRRIR